MTTNSQPAALERLIRVAQGDTGQSPIVANFLLAWWNAAGCGDFDLTVVWGVDTALAADMLQVFELVVARQLLPGRSGLQETVRSHCPRRSPGFVRE